MTGPWGCDAADTFQFQTLDHRHYRSPTDTLLMYAAGAVAAYVLLTAVARPPAYLPRCGAQIGSMIATVGDATGTRAAVHAVGQTGVRVSARAAAAVADVVNQVTTATGAGGGSNLYAASDSLTTTDVPKDAGVKLVDASGSRKSGDAWQTMTDAEKDKCETAVRGFLQTHDSGVVMLYAPWCSHCHNAMKPFAEASKAHKGVEFLMVNAEALPRSAFQGENALYNLQYFPSFAVQSQRGGALAAASSIEDALAQVSTQATPPPAASARVATAAEEEDAAGADPFAALF
tara:strand:- start:1605 stop:2471 length:867 start_codon:yes stop_codon:yes gene_type:complete